MSHDLFNGQLPLAGLILMREQAVDNYDTDGAEAGYAAMSLLADAALARVEVLERAAKDAQKLLARHDDERRAAGLGPGPGSKRSAEQKQERRVRAELHPHSGCVENVHPIRPPKHDGDAA